MRLLEKYDFQIGKFTKKDGTEGRKLYIIGDDIDNTYDIKEILKKNGFSYDKYSKMWFIYLSPDESKNQWIIDSKIKPVLDYCASIEDKGTKNRTGNDISESIKKQLEQVIKTTDELISDVKSATAPPKFDKSRLLTNLENFKQELVAIYDDEEFKKKMEPIIKFKIAQGYSFSFKNSILVLLQDSKATLVKAKKVWGRYFNRVVKPNSPSIALWYPKSTKEEETPEEAKDRREKTTVLFLQKVGKKSVKDLNPGEKDNLRILLRPVEEPSYFQLIPFFYDVRYTTQIPGTEDVIGHIADKSIEWFEHGEENESTRYLYDALLEVIRSTGVEIKFVDKIGDSDRIQGVSKSGRIEIKDKGEKSTGTIITMVHEFAHELLHQKYLQSHNAELRGYFIGTAQGRSCVEQQAELTAWIVMKGFGYDMKTAINYTTIWGMNKDNACKVFDQVASVANLIYNKTFEELEKTQAVLKEEKELGYLNLTGLDVAKMVGAEKEYQQSKYFGDMSSRMRKAEKNF